MIDLLPFKGARCIVLGGSGFIGQHLVNLLLASGASVITVSHRESPSAPSYSGQTYQHFRASIIETERISSILREDDYVFHLVDNSFPGARPEDVATVIESVTLPTAHLIAACSSARVKKLVFVSSGGAVYGLSKSQVHSEDSPTNPISAYGVGKLATEKTIQLAHHLATLKCAILRVSNPYGPGQSPGRGQGLVSAAMKSVMESSDIEVWGDGGVVRDFIFVEDVAAALAKAALYQGQEIIFNIGSGRGRRVIDVINDIRALVPETASNVIFKPGRAADVPISILDVSRAKSQLAWEPRTSWTDGLKTTKEWFKGDTKIDS